MVYVPAGDLALSSFNLYPTVSRIFGECGPPPRRLLEGSSASNGIRRPAATFFSVAGLLLAGAPDGAYFRRCWEWFTDCRAALGYVCIGSCNARWTANLVIPAAVCITTRLRCGRLGMTLEHSMDLVNTGSDVWR